MQRLIEGGVVQIFSIINSQIRPLPDVACVECFPYFEIHTPRFTWDTSQT